MDRDKKCENIQRHKTAPSGDWLCLRKEAGTMRWWILGFITHVLLLAFLMPGYRVFFTLTSTFFVGLKCNHCKIKLHHVKLISVKLEEQSWVSSFSPRFLTLQPLQRVLLSVLNKICHLIHQDVVPFKSADAKFRLHSSKIHIDLSRPLRMLLKIFHYHL